MSRLLKRLWHYLNPMVHLGEKKYPLLFPFLTAGIIYVLAEVIGNFTLHHPNDLGNYVIFINFALVLYFSFRSGIKGGLLITFFSVLYYAYYIYTRHASFTLKEYASLIAGLLSLTNLGITLIIGWLRETIDVLFAKEIQARLSAEHEQKRLQTLLEQLPIGVVLAEAPTGQIIYTNEETSAIFQRTVKQKSMEEYADISASVKGEQIQTADWPLAQALFQGKTIKGEEIELTTNNRKKILFVNSAPVYDAHGKIVAAVSTLLDLTKQRELEKQKDDFIAMASHELKTPLTSAKLYIQTLQKLFAKNPKANHLIKKMNSQIDKLVVLVTTMLDTTRIEQGKLQVQNEAFILKEVVEKTLDDLQNVSDRTLIFKGTLKEYVYGNKEKISQVITNLISNAIKYSPDTTDIIIDLQEKDNTLIVSVKDFGLGMSQEDKKHIFDKFYQSDQHKTYPGLGLGLYISAQILNQYDGHMWVESEKGKGSTFYFSLPIYIKR